MDKHFHGEYTDNSTTNSTTTGRGTDRSTVTRECLASADLAIGWLLDNALGHPQTITVRIDFRGQQHWFEFATRPHTDQPVPARARRRTRQQMSDVIGPAITRGEAVRAEVTISSVVRPRTLTVTPHAHPHPCPHHPSTTGGGHHEAEP